MIAIAIFFTNRHSSESAPLAATTQQATTANGDPRPISEADYILGNPNAPILMVEYSDYDCPFCKEFHATMHQIMDEYGVTGKVAWVYRQFPLVQLHPNSPKISEAALCVGKLGGNSAFWQFTDAIYESRNVDEYTNVTKLPLFAEEAGIPRSEYIACVDGKQMEADVTASIQDGLNAGALGTPYTVLMVGDQEAVVNGARTYETVKSIVQNLIDQLDGTFDTESVDASIVPTNARGVPVLD